MLVFKSRGGDTGDTGESQPGGNDPAKAKLNRLRTRDALTGLYNREHFMKLLDAALQKPVSSGVRALLGEGRKDESGDFTKGAGLSGEQADIGMGFVSARRDTVTATCARLAELVGASAMGAEGVA